MAEFDKYISDLLFEYDCVIVPQLGGFVTNYKPAEIDEIRGIANPGRKDIGFNRNLTRSDGLLEEAISTGKKITIQDASSFLAEEVERCWLQLNSGQKIGLKKIGVLFFDKEQNLQFEPSNEVNYLKDSFGLTSFELPPKLEKQIPEPVTVVSTEKIDEPTILVESVNPRKSKSIYWVAAATILPFVAMSAYMGVKTDFKSPTELNIAEILPNFGLEIEKAQYSERKSNRDLKTIDGKGGFYTDSKTFQFSFTEDRIDSTGVWVNLNKTNAPIAELSQGNYHVIGGCFSQKSNADKFVQKLNSKGLNASILDLHKNLYRVSISSNLDRPSALKELRKIREKEGFTSAWLLKKRTNS